MKKIISVILITIILFSVLAVTVCAENGDLIWNPVSLRAGGGSSGGGGGGGSSGGSGGSHSHGSGSGRQLTLFESILSFVLMPFVFFSSSIAFYIKLTKRSRKAKKLMKQMKKSDSAWKYGQVTYDVEEGFLAIQQAWTNMDMSTASQYMSDELLDSFQTKLNWMKYKNQRNVLEKISLVSALPVAVYDDSDNSRDYIWFYIKGRMVDYTIDTDTQLIVEGSTSPSSFVEYWKFVRRNDRWVLSHILQKNEEDQIPFAE